MTGITTAEYSVALALVNGGGVGGNQGVKLAEAEKVKSYSFFCLLDVQMNSWLPRLAANATEKHPRAVALAATRFDHALRL